MPAPWMPAAVVPPARACTVGVSATAVTLQMPRSSQGADTCAIQPRPSYRTSRQEKQGGAIATAESPQFRDTVKPGDMHATAELCQCTSYIVQDKHLSKAEPMSMSKLPAEQVQSLHGGHSPGAIQTTATLQAPYTAHPLSKSTHRAVGQNPLSKANIAFRMGF